MGHHVKTITPNKRWQDRHDENDADNLININIKLTLIALNNLFVNENKAKTFITTSQADLIIKDRKITLVVLKYILKLLANKSVIENLSDGTECSMKLLTHSYAEDDYIFMEFNSLVDNFLKRLSDVLKGIPLNVLIESNSGHIKRLRHFLLDNFFTGGKAALRIQDLDLVITKIDYEIEFIKLHYGLPEADDFYKYYPDYDIIYRIGVREQNAIARVIGCGTQINQIYIGYDMQDAAKEQGKY